MPTAVSLFSGCGGSDIGLHKAGFDILMANDILPYARDVYRANLPDTDFRLGDVAKIKNFPRADLLVGCYPCQGFSQGGVRDPSRTINYLYREFDRALRQIKPKAFIVENVSGMRRADFRHLLNNQIVRFRLAGYKVKSELLDARDFGVAQERQRVFIVGIRADLDDIYEFPMPAYFADARRGQRHLTIRDAIGDLPEWPDGEFNNEVFHWYYLSRNRYRGWEETSRTIVAKGRHVSLHPISPKLKRIHTDKWVFEDDRPARRLSFRECARLQGFPKAMKFPDTAILNEKYKVVGNAVPPPLFNAVASALPNVW
ncbi:DNA cytosine methyltransferase [Mesorhizobium sp. CA15]|uniref:DNA cytosine methyltransferase n=1 Tax=Mesorhizobium sp. CA15 TaxID=2876641 RepID=UPI001CD0DC9E|nr:DNA (cytosine-5-)-methyltransferase [Mesorhizobium sp. CA15]MBZ9869216.1 DNA cytosine methyltransferase [Mesorhizobium sp. CA15]